MQERTDYYLDELFSWHDTTPHMAEQVHRSIDEVDEPLRELYRRVFINYLAEVNYRRQDGRSYGSGTTLWHAMHQWAEDVIDDSMPYTADHLSYYVRYLPHEWYGVEEEEYPYEGPRAYRHHAIVQNCYTRETLADFFLDQFSTVLVDHTWCLYTQQRMRLQDGRIVLRGNNTVYDPVGDVYLDLSDLPDIKDKREADVVYRDDGAFSRDRHAEWHTVGEDATHVVRDRRSGSRPRVPVRSHVLPNRYTPEYYE